ncbi:carboxylating nicotinate-nucleotide diphosphorylase [soil metagenome]
MTASPELRDQVARALAEDVGSGDVTANAVIAADVNATARIVQKSPGVVFGFGVAAEVFEQMGAARFESLVGEGAWLDDVPRDIARVTGPGRAILTAERTALNFLGHLSGIATLTTQFVERALKGGAQILDTRKTIPGLRTLEKAAVAAGGGSNHRMGLHDAVLIKENHARLAGGVAEAVSRAQAGAPGLPVVVEVRDAVEVRQALDSGADRLLLDNMGMSALKSAVATRNEAERETGRRAELEASGGVSLATVAAISETAVDFISVGALTHSAPALDLSLLVDAG